MHISLTTDQFCSSESIDLAEESGVVKNMNERPSEQFASEYLEYRRTYILVDVKREWAVIIYRVDITHDKKLSMQINKFDA
jgi:hypothetical protein